MALVRRELFRQATRCLAPSPSCIPHVIHREREERPPNSHLSHSKFLCTAGSSILFHRRLSPRPSMAIHGISTLAEAAAAAAPVLHFTPASAALGGLVLGTAASANLLLTGRVTGISGAIKGVVQPGGDHAAWRMAFLLSMLLVAFPMASMFPGAFDAIPASFTATRAIIGGLLVGLGTSLGNGCTSGHGICGNARLATRSVVFTLVFMASGMLAASMTGTLDALGVAPVAAAFQGPAGAEVSMALTAAAATAVGAAALALAGSKAPSMKPALDTAAAGLVGASFGTGLVLSGMTHPSKVAGFLSPLSPAWDLSLPFVMGTAVGLSFLAFQSVMGKLWSTPQALSAPALAPAYCLPSTHLKVDSRLVLGGVLFGAGWGISGMCPGPAIVSLVTMSPQVMMYLGALAAGMVIEPVITRAFTGHTAPPSPPTSPRSSTSGNKVA